jgi:hypothetical protein
MTPERPGCLNLRSSRASTRRGPAGRRHVAAMVRGPARGPSRSPGDRDGARAGHTGAGPVGRPPRRAERRGPAGRSLGPESQRDGKRRIQRPSPKSSERLSEQPRRGGRTSPGASARVDARPSLTTQLQLQGPTPPVIRTPQPFRLSPNHRHRGRAGSPRRPIYRQRRMTTNITSPRRLSRGAVRARAACAVRRVLVVDG